MSSLTELLNKIHQLPPAELALVSAPPAERPEEMALLETIIRAAQIEDWRKRGVSVKRACYLKEANPEIVFQVVNGVAHTIRVRFEANRPLVTKNGQAVAVDTVESFSGLIVALAEG